MLVLTRKPGQAFVLTTSNGIVIIRTLANDRIAIEAPAGVEIVREEIQGRRGLSHPRRKLA